MCSIDKYRQLPTDDAENKNLDKRVSFTFQGIKFFCLCVDSHFIFVPVDPPSHSTW